MTEKKPMTPSEMGKKGGKISAEKRFENRTPEEISELMRAVRLSPKNKIKFHRMAQAMVDNLNKNVSE